jgi:hypothetical protein
MTAVFPWVLGLTLALGVGVTALGAEPDAPRDIVEILSDGIFTEREIHGILADETEVVRMKEVSERELAVALGCLTSETPAQVMDRLRDAGPLSAGPEAELSIPLSPAEPEAGLSGVTLGENGRSEADRFVVVEPGYDLNLDDREMARFQALEGGAAATRVEAVESTLRLVLAGRVAGFAAGGLVGSSYYARGGGERSLPGHELEQSYEAFRAEPPLFPGLPAAWNDYPNGLPKDADEKFFVSRSDVDGRPVVILTHRMIEVLEDRGVLAERDFYVSQFFDAALNAVAVLPSSASEDNLFLFVHRVWVDRWNGWVSLKRAAGHKAIRKRLHKSHSAREICGR